MCGTTFLHLQVLRSDEYEHIRGSWNIPEDFVVYRVVRDPIQRFYSWYNVYINQGLEYPDTSHIFIKDRITEENIEQWFELFKTVMHYDEHTALQKYIHQFDNRFNHNKIGYISSEHIQKFLDNSKENHNERTYEHSLKSKIDKYLQEVYKEDIDWIRTLEVIK
jgi:hypothetical protein